jgi:hypothetical protein
MRQSCKIKDELGRRRGRSGAESGWGGADPRYTSEAKRTREHTAFASLSSETDSSYSLPGSARTGGVLGFNRDTNRRRQGMDPDRPARETMAGIEQGPFAPLDAALAAIEKHTRGVCRHHPSEDHP